MQVTFGKVLGLLTAIGYVLVMVLYAHETPAKVFNGSLSLVLPLALIWFPEELGSFTGYVGRGGRINTESPPFLVSFMGWFLLIGIPVVLYLLR